MNTILSKKPIALAVVLATAALAGAAPAFAAEEFDEFKVLIEINATDGDAGFHALLDGGPWDFVRMRDPDGKKIFNAKPSNALKDQGLTENFFESAEPLCDEEDAAEEGEDAVTLAEFLERFPEGEYKLAGRDQEGERLLGEAELTFDLPAAPDIEMTEEMAFEFDPENPDLTPIVVMWEPGDDLGEKCHDQDLIDTGVISDPAEVEVIGWETVIEPEDDESIDPQRIVAVQLRADQNSFTIPPEYLASLWDDVAEDGALLVKFEVGAIEESHNQTFSEGVFCLYDESADDCSFEDE